MSRLLSCLQFIYCSSSSSAADGLHDLSTFGESWNWGVCTLIHLVSQRRKFELLDLGLHVARIDAIAPIDRERLESLIAASAKKNKLTDGDRNEILILDFLACVQKVRLRNDAIFDSLESYLPPAQPIRFHVSPQDESQAPTGPSAPIGAIQAGPSAARQSVMGGQGQSLMPPPPAPAPAAPVDHDMPPPPSASMPLPPPPAPAAFSMAPPAPPAHRPSFSLPPPPSGGGIPLPPPPPGGASLPPPPGPPGPPGPPPPGGLPPPPMPPAHRPSLSMPPPPMGGPPPSGMPPPPFGMPPPPGGMPPPPGPPGGGPPLPPVSGRTGLSRR